MPTPECQLLSDESRKICGVVEAWAKDHRVPVFVRKSAKGLLRHLVIREGKNTGERMVNLIAKSDTAQVDDLAERLKASGIPITTFLFTAYDGLADVAAAGERQIFWGDGIIQEKLGDVILKVNPSSFMQTNTRAAEKMIDVLKSWTDGGKTLIDLYCGSGAIGLNLSKKFDDVIGVESNKSAVEDAHQNAVLNMVTNIQFLEGRAETLAASLPVKENANDTVVIVDPPRPGLLGTMVETLLDWAVPSLFYVSCNPETLARDLQALSVRYDILDVQPMDFFPHTDHIETAVRLRLR
jgi:23S rRNA (uracil1939-C5)-methyltransferase